jgi:hypothetical protein
MIVLYYEETEKTWSGSIVNVEEKETNSIGGLVPLRLDILFSTFKFYNYFVYSTLYAEIPLYDFSTSCGLNPIEIGMKFLITPPSSMFPLEIRLGYFLSRSHTHTESGAYGRELSSHYENIHHFYVGVSFHFGFTVHQFSEVLSFYLIGSQDLNRKGKIVLVINTIW